MKNRKTAFGIIAAVLLIMLLLTAGSEEGAAPPTEGRLTITGLEEYEGCYVIAMAVTEDGLNLIAAEDTNFQTNKTYGGRIVNSSVTMNVWSITGSDKIEPYSGTDENVIMTFMILRTPALTLLPDVNDLIGGRIIYSVDYRSGIAFTEYENEFSEDIFEELRQKFIYLHIFMGEKES